MTNEENKLLVRRYIEEVWNARDAEAARRFFAPEYTRRLSPTDSLDGEGQKRRIEGFLAAFPDIRLEISELFGEGGLFTFVGTIHGTHAGEFMGVAATGGRVSVSLIDVVRVEDGKFVEHWGGPDVFGLMRQIREGL